MQFIGTYGQQVAQLSLLHFTDTRPGYRANRAMRPPSPHQRQRIFIKPLPLYLLSYDFWGENILSDKLYKSASGFLLSYIWLIASELDFRIAVETGLLPQSWNGYLTWDKWKILTVSFLRHVDIGTINPYNKRYHYGILQLGRVDTIYRLRFFSTHFVRGYLYDVD
jgi:hypothetical protein